MKFQVNIPMYFNKKNFSQIISYLAGDVYAWLVVFVLPLNSAVNPLLYTFTTPKYRAQILPWGWTRLTGRSNHLNGSGGASNQGIGNLS